jgi:hypothetical protein
VGAVPIGTVCHIAVCAQNPKSFGKVVLDNPRNNGLAVAFPLADFATVGVSASMNMVNVQKFNGGLAAASARASVVFDHFPTSIRPVCVCFVSSVAHPFRILSLGSVIIACLGLRRFKIGGSLRFCYSGRTLFASLIVAALSRFVFHKICGRFSDLAIGTCKSVHAQIISRENDIRAAYYGARHRDDSGLDLLREARITTHHCPV